MFIGHVLKQYMDGDLKVLDLCAAPGGKSTLLASLMNRNSLLVSNEVIRSRANILAENMIKWGGYPNNIVTNNDPAQIGKLHNYFDVILVDAPCSGEGMFRKDEGAINEWSVENVKLCKERQQRILADIWPALKTSGILVYSTCTYNLEENEENVGWIRDELGAEVLPVEIEKGWRISPSFVKEVPAYRFFPYKTKGEGFFCALLRKTEEADDWTDLPKKPKDKGKKMKESLPVEYKNFLLNDKEFSFYTSKERWYAFPASMYDDLSTLRKSLNVMSEGICLGEFKGKDFVPDQSLAMSIYLNKENFIIHDIDWRTAINYLRKEPLALPDQPKGFVLLTYKNMPLGFVKNIGNRANNLYPQEWRIRSSNIPDEPTDVY